MFLTATLGTGENNLTACRKAGSSPLSKKGKSNSFPYKQANPQFRRKMYFYITFANYTNFDSGIIALSATTGKVGWSE